MDYNLPKSWLLTTLDNIGQIISGGTPSTSIQEYWGGEVSWISPVDLSKNKAKYISKGAKSITILGLLKSSAKLMPAGSVLFSSRAPIGYVVIAAKELCTNQGFKSIIPNEAINNEYLYYFLIASKRQADDLASGTTFKEISLSNFSLIKIPLPPLAEQQRIVAKIEELFSELDKGIETLKTAQQQLKVYRQAVLKYAFEGKLTSSENYMKPTILGEILEVVSGNTPKGIEQELGTGSFQFYKVSDMNLGGNKVQMKFSNHLIDDKAVEKLKIKIFPEGTVVFPKRGGAILTNKKRMLSMPSSFDLNLMGVLPNEFVNKHFLFYWFLKLDLSKIYDGSSVPQINNKNILPLIFPLYPLEIQLLIVQEIESRLSVCDKIEENIEQGLQQAEALRQSILKKSFEGKLVPQDPNDEPARVLLERIKEERVEAQSEKKTKTKKVRA
jgi:type I restriction enzyme S subunit